MAEAAVAKPFPAYCRYLGGEMSSFSVNHAPASLEPPDRDPTRNLDAVLQSFADIP